MRRVLLAMVVAAASVVLLGGTAASAVPEASCQLFQSGPAPDSSLDVGWTSRLTYLAPQTVSSVSGAATVDGHPGWAVFFDNHTGSTVTNPGVSLSSSLDPAVFDGEVPSFPFSCSLPSLDPNQEMQVFPGLEATGLHSSFSLGYDSTRSVSPAVVPAGGGDVNVQFSVTLTDPRFADGFIGLFVDHGGNVSIVSETAPTNLDQGESASPSPNAVQDPSANDGVFALSNAQLGKTYVFSAVLHVGASGFGEPWTFEPGAQIYVSGQGQGCTLACNAPGSSVTFDDPSFGSVTTSVDQSDRRWNVATDTQYVTVYQDGLFPDLDASVSSGTGANVSAMTDAVAHGTTLSGHSLLGWQFGIGNLQSGNTVTDPTISVASGYDASQLFPNFAGVPASSLPIVATQPSLAPGTNLGLGLGSFIPAATTPGCDSSRSVTPATVPVGGGEQTFTFDITCFDPGVRSVNGGVQQFLPGSTVVSFTPPSNLDQGEGLNAPPDSWFGAPGDAHAGFGIGVENLVTGKQYTFTFVVDSPNPFGIPYAQTASIGMEEDSPQPSGCVGCGGARASITVAEPTLDGPTHDAGQVTFSAGEPHVWLVDVEHTQKINYDGTQQIGLDYDGPPSAVDGQSVTLVASWEGLEFPAHTPVVFTLGSQSCTATTGSLSNPFGDEGAVCSITLAQPIGTHTLEISSPGDITVYPARSSAQFAVTGPTSTAQCKDGGWKAFAIFKNQGDCVSYVATGGKNSG